MAGRIVASFMIALAVAAGLVLLVGTAGGPPVMLSMQGLAYPVRVPALLLPLGGMAVVALLVLFGWLARDPSFGMQQVQPVPAVLGAIMALSVLGAVTNQVSFLAAGIACAMASGAFVTAWLVAILVVRGEAMELESSWGGLGGGLGGWRLSRAAGLALLALALIGGAVAVVQAPAPGATAAKPAPDAAGGAGKPGTEPATEGK